LFLFLLYNNNYFIHPLRSFPKEFEATSSHKLRHSNDMQFSFSYFYYLMGVPKEWDSKAYFEDIDTNNDGILNNNEIRTLAAKLLPVPFSQTGLKDLQDKLRNCSGEVLPSSEPFRISVRDVLFCDALIPLFQTSIKSQLKYKFQLMEEKEIDFHMIRTNFTKVRNILDGMRKQRKKFVCLNDDIDHSNPESELVIDTLQELYEAYFPHKSPFELPDGQENEFLYYEEFTAKYAPVVLVVYLCEE